MKKITLIIIMLGALIIANAQIEKKELKLTPEIEDMVVAEIKNLPEKEHFQYGITDRLQLTNLHLGKPIPRYRIVNEKLEDVNTWSVSRMSDGEPLSLRFENSWIVPVMADETPLSFGSIAFLGFGGRYFLSGIKNIIEHFCNYEHKDSIIGFVNLTSSNLGMDDLFIIRKENEDIFVQVYDEATGEYFKNEYRFSELFTLLKDLYLREKEAKIRRYAQIANKTELKLTPELTKMIVNEVYSSHINDSDKSLSDWGIKDRAQLEHLYLGNPIPIYAILYEDLTFMGRWQVPVMSNDEPLFLTRIQLDDNGQYRWVGRGGSWAEAIHNYEHKDLIIGYLDSYPFSYLIIRKEDKDIFVKIYDYATREYCKDEYSLSEVLNLLKQ